MSVKFEKETTTKTTAAVADALEGKDGVMHNLGQALTKGGGPNGYLAVSVAQLGALSCNKLTGVAIGIPQAAAEQPVAHQDANFGYSVWSPRVPGLVDRPRQEQVGSLLHLACPQDGYLRCLDQRAPWTRLD